jgi:hypothetical protein
VFQQLINYLLGPSVVVATWDNEICAVIAGRGRPFERVIERRDGYVRVKSRSLPGLPKAQCSCDVTWRDSIYCKDIEISDILWQTEGAPLFSIIRSCKDHFDVIMINVEIKVINYNANKDVRNAVTPLEGQLQTCEWAGWRQVVLAWDWLPMAQQNHEKLCAFLQGDRRGLAARNSRLSRLSASAQIFDDLQDYEKLSTLIPVMLDFQDDLEPQSHARLLEIICSHWQSYILLKTHIEELRWCLWKLEFVSHQQADSYASVAQYWSEGNCLSWDVIDLASLDLTPLSTDIQAIKSANPAHWTQFDSLPLLMFPSYLEAATPPSLSDRDQLRRYLVGLILLRKHLKPYGSRILPPEALSVHLAMFGGVGRGGPGYTTQNSLSTLTIISEHTNHDLHLSATMLEMIGKHSDALQYLSFLLAECYKDVEIIYNILATAVQYLATRVEYSRARKMFSGIFAKGDLNYPMGLWFCFNIETLDHHIRHTDLVTITESHENDKVVPALISVFERYGRAGSVWGKVSQPHSSRAMILRGIDEFWRTTVQGAFGVVMWEFALQGGLYRLPTKGSLGGLGLVD